jgi:hypothetical protein
MIPDDMYRLYVVFETEPVKYIIREQKRQEINLMNF